MRIAVAWLVVVALSACGAPAPDDPCARFTCATPAPPRCDGDTRVVTQGGTCGAGDDGLPACTFGEDRTDCTQTGEVCAAGACRAPDDPCAALTCDQPPPASCDLDVLTSYAKPGTCSAPGGGATCSYAATTTACTAPGAVCDAHAGACVTPCDPNPCTAPPPDACSGETRVDYPAIGTCTVAGNGVGCVYTPAKIDCAAIDRACAGGACVDPCATTTCATPPAAACSGDTLTTFAAAGTCTAPGGVAACGYAATATDCTAVGQICDPAIAACKDAVVIGACRLIGAADLSDLAGSTHVVHGRVLAPGVTDRSGVDDLDPHLAAQLGLGTGADPSTWTWIDAAPDLSYGPGAPGYVAAEDDYLATLTLPDQPGAILSFAFRFSPDDGHTWIYADLGAGSTDGFGDPGSASIVAPYISEYVDGSGQGDAIEVYNPGRSPMPLAGCAIDVYKNGSTTAELHELGTVDMPAIAPGDVFVLCSTAYNNVDKDPCDKRIPPPQWDGNDAIALRCGTVNLDVLGQIGFDPGNEWGAGVTSTGQNTLLRKCDVVAGDRDGSDPFVPAVEWQGYGTDTTFLGARNCPLPPP